MPTRRCDSWRRKSAHRGAAPRLRASSPTSTGCRKSGKTTAVPFRDPSTPRQTSICQTHLARRARGPKQASAAMEFEIELDSVTEDERHGAQAATMSSPSPTKLPLDAVTPSRSMASRTAARTEPEPGRHAYAIEIDAAASDAPAVGSPHRRIQRLLKPAALSRVVTISTAPAVEPEPTDEPALLSTPEPTYEPEIASAPEPTSSPSAVPTSRRLPARSSASQCQPEAAPPSQIATYPARTSLTNSPLDLSRRNPPMSRRRLPGQRPSTTPSTNQS